MPQFWHMIISRWAILATCVAVLSGILIAALWPFHSPRNQVTWVDHQNALRFGRYGTVLSSGTLTLANSGRSSYSLELWLEPALTWTTGNIFSLYDPLNSMQLSIRQHYTDLVLQGSGGSQFAEMSVADVFRKQQVFVTITSTGQDTVVYIDGQLAKQAPVFWRSSASLSGQLVLGDSPLRSDSWRGQVRGLAIYKGAFSSEQVAEHCANWMQGRESHLNDDTSALAIYLFDEHVGRVIHNEIKPGVELYIPSRYLVIDQLRFETPWSEFHTQPNYLNNCLVNIAGFVPLGFIFSFYFTEIRQIKWSDFAIIILGSCVSFMIEFAQAYLPTRYSGMTDIITNTLGTAVGVVLYRVTAVSLARLKAMYLHR